MAKISSGKRWIWVMNTYSESGCAECCEICGESISGTVRERQSMRLCPACSKALDTMPVTVKSSMERFLIGNVC